MFSAVALPRLFTVRFSVKNVLQDAERRSILRIADADNEWGALAVYTAAGSVGMVEIRYSQTNVIPYANLLPVDTSGAWTTITISVGEGTVTAVSSFSPTALQAALSSTGTAMLDTTSRTYVVFVSGSGLSSTGGYIRDLQITGEQACCPSLHIAVSDLGHLL